MSGAIRILYSDESPADRGLVETALQKGPGCFEVTEAVSCDELSDYLEKRTFDVILTELTLQGCGRLQPFEFAHKQRPEIPIIIVTHPALETVAQEALKQGATDYIIKTPALLERLPERVQAALEKQRSQNAQELEQVDPLKLSCDLQRQLTDCRTELAEARQELQSFLYSVSHDLRAPLRAIEGFSRILADDFSSQLEPDALHCLEVIVTSTKKTEELVEALLSFSRLGQIPMAKSSVDMDALVKSVVAEVERTETRPGLQLKLLPMAVAFGEPALLRQVILHLVGNAFKFTRNQSDACVEIGSFRSEDADVYYVKDNGIGFDMRYAPKLFSMFQRLHPSEGYAGHGTGLAIVKRIVQRHGGRVWAEGKVGEGACFYFKLPPAELMQ